MLEIRRKQSLSSFSTFKIGGEALFFTTVFSQNQMIEALSWAETEKLPYLVVGKGSNLLFDDEGFFGLVIHNKMGGCAWEKDRVRVESGYSFALLGIQSARRGFSGLEFAAGIPGSVGGAIFMNAGSNGFDTRGVLREVSFWEGGRKRVYQKEELTFSYRFSPFQEKKGIILEGVFQLKEGERAKEKQREWLEKRKATQPLQEKSVGCIFKNPKEGPPAAYLIEKNGLKGFSIGGAKVSEKHANFIINQGGATSKEVRALIAFVQEKIRKEDNIFLEAEVWYVPYQRL